MAPTYERTRAWQTALAPRADDPDERPRDRLRVAFRSMRDKAATLAGEIARDLPDYTVHDVTHLDALWELVDLIGGEDLTLNPCEIFVLGGALLTHDLGMTAAAYPGGRDELRAQERWRDTVARLMRREGLVHRPNQAPPEDVAARADREVLRLLHADKAREIPKQRWTDRQGRDVRFMEDDDLRERFGPLIGEHDGDEVDAHHDVLAGRDHRAPVGRAEDVVRAEHQHVCFRLCLNRQR